MLTMSTRSARMTAPSRHSVRIRKTKNAIVLLTDRRRITGERRFCSYPQKPQAVVRRLGASAEPMVKNTTWCPRCSKCRPRLPTTDATPPNTWSNWVTTMMFMDGLQARQAGRGRPSWERLLGHSRLLTPRADSASIPIFGRRCDSGRRVRVPVQGASRENRAQVPPRRRIDVA